MEKVDNLLEKEPFIKTTGKRDRLGTFLKTVCGIVVLLYLYFYLPYLPICVGCGQGVDLPRRAAVHRSICAGSADA